MHFTMATVPGDAQVLNEDWVAATPDLLVVLDGATIRTDTGCRHGAAWYTHKLGSAIIARAATGSRTLELVMADAIADVAAQHPECDLTHPGTPSAAAAVLRIEDDLLRYLVLGDVTAVFDTRRGGVTVVSDQRVSATATADRADADRHPIGSAEKATALERMKYGELAARNRPGGYWIAAADPTAVKHALTGYLSTDTVTRLAVMTDGAARAVEMFHRYSWNTALDTISKYGPEEFIRLVRWAEAADPLGTTYQRNKTSDDATVIFGGPTWATAGSRDYIADPRTELTLEQRQQLATGWLNRTLNAPGVYGDGILQRAMEERRREQRSGEATH